MNDLIIINTTDSDRPTVMGRELHTALEIKTQYSKWFERMCEYGFAENSDYVTLVKNVYRADGTEMPKQQTDHQLTIDMAKEICMIQRSEKGKQCRQYFIEVEKKWNSPEAVMARALQFAERQLESVRIENIQLNEKVGQLETANKIQEQQIAELQPKASYYDIILNCDRLIPISVIAKDYGKSGTWLNKYLYEKGVQYCTATGVWLLYQFYADKGYTSTKSIPFKKYDGTFDFTIHTYWTQKGRLFIYDLLKSDNILPLIERAESYEN